MDKLLDLDSKLPDMPSEHNHSLAININSLSKQAFSKVVLDRNMALGQLFLQLRDLLGSSKQWEVPKISSPTPFNTSRPCLTTQQQLMVFHSLVSKNKLEMRPSHNWVSSTISGQTLNLICILIKCSRFLTCWQ